MIAAAVLASPAAAQDVAEIIEPSSRWNLNVGDSSCRAGRIFGEGSNRHVLIMDRLGPGDYFNLVVAGPAVERLKLNAGSNGLAFGFGPDEAMQERSLFLSTFPEFGAALTGTVAFADLSDDAAGETDKDNAIGYRVSAEREKAIQWLDVRTKKSPGFRLETGSMGNIMAAMRQCTRDLMEQWGIDVERHESMIRTPKPLNDASDWVSEKDYTSAMIRRGDQGVVRFRLSIDAEGSPTQCHVQGGTAPEALNDYACKLLLRRARFDPALDKNGEPMESFYRASVRFLLPR